MRARRTPRLGPDDVDRLLAGGAAGPDHRALAALLDAARAAPTPEELAGERTAVAGYVAAYRDGAAAQSPTGRNRARRPSFARAATMKVAASVAVLAVGGTAVAAETGSLPAAAQRHAHNLFGGIGVPPPDTPDRPAATPAPSAAGVTAPATGASPGATESPDAGEVRARGLCRAWTAHRSPGGRKMSAAARRELAALAGGSPRIAGFCATRAGAGTPAPSGSPSQRTPGSPAPGTTHGNSGNGPGNGNGNGAGNDDGQGNGNGQGDGADGQGNGNGQENGNRLGNGHAAGAGTAPAQASRE